MSNKRIHVIGLDGLTEKVFGPYGSIVLNDGVIVMREDEYESVDKMYKIPDGYTLEFEEVEQGGFDQ